MKIRIAGTALMVAAVMSVAPMTFAGDKKDHACCATNASNDKKMCTDFASLGVSAEQKARLESLQADCMKAGCTKESRARFLQQAQGILSADQFARLKKECDATVAKTGA